MDEELLEKGESSKSCHLQEVYHCDRGQDKSNQGEVGSSELLVPRSPTDRWFNESWSSDPIQYS